jgi:hypothetical protein
MINHSTQPCFVSMNYTHAKGRNVSGRSTTMQRPGSTTPPTSTTPMIPAFLTTTAFIPSLTRDLSFGPF